jgi:hypothetical protein
MEACGVLLAAVGTRRKSQTVTYMCLVTKRCGTSNQIVLIIDVMTACFEGVEGPLVSSRAKVGQSQWIQRP